MDNYSFCESTAAGSLSLWHIRKLTSVGRKLGGGADTESLCGKRMSWDVGVEMTKRHLDVNTCKKCLKIYAEKKGGE
jgi:thymidine phosphorylase